MSTLYWSKLKLQSTLGSVASLFEDSRISAAASTLLNSLSNTGRPHKMARWSKYAFLAFRYWNLCILFIVHFSLSDVAQAGPAV